MKTKETKVTSNNRVKDTILWLTDIVDWKMLLRSIPGSVTMIFVVAVVVMNLMAGKTIIMTEPSWLGVTGGLLLSWIPFLCMDVVVKTYGAKAATKLNLLGLAVNLICIGMFQLIANIQFGGDAETYAAFNATFSQTWQIFVASSIAFIVSGIVNNVMNVSIGKLFKENPDGKVAYMARTYISTAIGQFVDNFVFTYLAFLVFFKLSIGTTLGWSLMTVIGAGVFGALLELLMEVVFSPIGYAICKSWREEAVGKDYVDYCNTMEVKKDIRRITF